MAEKPRRRFKRNPPPRLVPKRHNGVDAARLSLGWIFSKFGLIVVAGMVSGIFNGYREIVVNGQKEPQTIDLKEPQTYRNGLNVSATVEVLPNQDVFLDNPLTQAPATLLRLKDCLKVFIYRPGPKTAIDKSRLSVTGKWVCFDEPGEEHIGGHKFNLQSVYMQNEIQIPPPAYLIESG